MELKKTHKFALAITKELTPVFKRAVRDELSRDSLTPEQRRQADLFHAITSVIRAGDQISLSVRYIEVASRRPSDIGLETHLRYHYETMVQNAYVAREKMIRIIPQIHMIDGKWLNKTKYKSLHKAAKKEIKRAFSEVSRLREIIVHHPFDYQDENLTSAEMYAFLDNNDDEDFSGHYKNALWFLKMDKRRQSRKLECLVEVQIEGFFGSLGELYLRDGKIRLPEAS